MLVCQCIIMVISLQHVMTIPILSTTNKIQASENLDKLSTPVLITKGLTTTARVSNAGQQPRNDEILGLPRRTFIIVGTSAAVVIIIIIVVVTFCCRRRRQAVSLQRASGRNVPISSSNEALSTNGKQNMAMNSPSPMLNFDGRLSFAEARFTLQDSTRNKTPFPDVIPEREVIRHDLGYHGPCPDPPTDEYHTPVLSRPASASAVAPSPLCNNARIRQPAKPLYRGAEPLPENCMPSMLVSDTERYCSGVQGRKDDAFDGPACEFGRPDYADLDRPVYAVLDGPDASDGPDDADLNGPVYGNISGPYYADNDGPYYDDRDCPNSPAISSPDYGVYDEDDYAELSPVIIEKSRSLDLRNRPGYQPSKDELPFRPTERQSSMSMAHKDHLSHNSTPNYSMQETRLGDGMNRARPIITKSNTFTGRVKPFEMKQFTTGRTMTTVKESVHNSEPCSTQQMNKNVTECVKWEGDDIYLEPNAMVQEYTKAVSLKSAGAQEKTPTLPGSAIKPAFREKIMQVMEETRRAGDEEALYVTPNSVIPDLKRAHTEKSPSRAKDWAPIILEDRVGSPLKKREVKTLITTRLAAQDADTAIYAQPNAVIPEFKRAHTEKIRPRTPDIMSPTRPKYKVGKQSMRGAEPSLIEGEERLDEASFYEEPNAMKPELKRFPTEKIGARLSDTPNRACPQAGLQVTKEHEQRVDPVPSFSIHKDHGMPAHVRTNARQDTLYDNCGFTMEEENPYYGVMATADEPLFDVYQSINEEDDIYTAVMPNAER
eukprot:Seg2751.1 transcript_id=Seg2751.1/GoldUCD/mRNA.D3Y31 product="hypothetical protein" protein_id=Seg2751.1/GoldUCD/D3Y31